MHGKKRSVGNYGKGKQKKEGVSENNLESPKGERKLEMVIGIGKGKGNLNRKRASEKGKGS